VTAGSKVGMICREKFIVYSLYLLYVDINYWIVQKRRETGQQVQTVR